MSGGVCSQPIAYVVRRSTRPLAQCDLGRGGRVETDDGSVFYGVVGDWADPDDFAAKLLDAAKAIALPA